MMMMQKHLSQTTVSLKSTKKLQSVHQDNTPMMGLLIEIHHHSFLKQGYSWQKGIWNLNLFQSSKSLGA